MSLITAQLPVRLTPLVGRESELTDIVHAVAQYEKGALLAGWPLDGDVDRVLAGVMALRLPLYLAADAWRVGPELPVPGEGQGGPR